MRQLTVLMWGFVVLWSGQCSKILMLFPTPSFSHFALGFRLGKELARKGHQITMVSCYPQKTPITNYQDVSVEENKAIFDDFHKDLFEHHKKSAFETMSLMIRLGVKLTEQTLKIRGVQELLNSQQTFNLVIVEHFFNAAITGFGHRFKAPVILLATASTSRTNCYVFANPSPSSYVPSVFLPYTQRMSFWERVQNLIINIVEEIMRQWLYLPKQRELLKKFINPDLELDDVLYNTSLLFVNSHLSINNPMPLFPSIVEIGGFHVDPPKKLPDDLLEFLDDAKDGVVLFSMGSNLQSKDMKPELRIAVLKAFAKIKQKVLWKFEIDFPDAPKNVKIMKWVQQQDILAHPNVKAFISHGGLLSTIEAVYHGVPIIGIPVFGDQRRNVAAAVHAGYAVTVPFTELSEEKLSWALNEILSNPMYRQNIKQRSKVMHDQPMKPLNAAVFWTEHVIRHRGAPHLRSSGVDLVWYQRNLVDVIVFLISIAIAVFVIMCFVVRRIVALCFANKQRVNEGKKKN